MRHLLIAFLAALLATTAQAQVIPGPRPGGGISASTVTNIVTGKLTNNTVNAQSIFAPNTYIPTSNLSNTWVKYGTITLGATGTSWTIGVPTAQVVRLIGKLGIDCLNLGGSLDGSGRLFLRQNGDSGMNYHYNTMYNNGGTASSYATNALWIESGGITSLTNTYDIDIEFMPGNSTSYTNTAGYVAYTWRCFSFRPEGPSSVSMMGRGRYVGGSIVTNLTFTSSTLGKLFTSNGVTSLTYWIIP